jgi:hypothetical protein
VDAYLHIQDGKKVWDAPDTMFGVTDARGERYALEQYKDYIMVDNQPLV